MNPKLIRRPKLVRSGAVWQEPARARAQVVRRVCETLLCEYGKPRFGNPHNPIEDLVYIVLSNKTGPDIARKVFRELKREFFTWEELADARLGHLRRILTPAGLSDVKSRQLRAALRKVRKDFGRCSLSGLKGEPGEEVESYLTSLPGVSDKVAKCIMMYTLGCEVLPVDTHVHRVARRLGWTSRKRSDQCHEELEALIKPQYRYAFHVGCIVHGRQICRPTMPLCGNCVIRRYCKYFRDNVSNGKIAASD
jgi:endonuclease III